MNKTPLKFLLVAASLCFSSLYLRAQEEKGFAEDIIAVTDSLPAPAAKNILLPQDSLPPARLKVDWSGLPKDKIRIWPLAMFAVAADFRHDRILITKAGLQEEVKDDFFKNFHSGADNYLQYLPSLSPFLLDAFKVPSYHDKPQRNLMMLEANAFTIASVTVLKRAFHDLRPDGSAYNSFPSGHTAMAFTGAAILDHEYGKQYPWIKWAGYGVATLVGISRMANNRHWASDVVGGAALGIISTDLVYWLNRHKLSRHVHQPNLL